MSATGEEWEDETLPDVIEWLDTVCKQHFIDNGDPETSTITSYERYTSESTIHALVYWVLVVDKECEFILEVIKYNNGIYEIEEL